jgi:hypothetical protein
VSEADDTIPTMDAIIDMASWRRRRDGGEAPESPADLPDADTDDASVLRLEDAIQRLHGLVALALDGRGRLDTKVETELLAIVGELTVGLVTEAAGRAERLADRLAVGKAGRAT